MKRLNAIFISGLFLLLGLGSAPQLLQAEQLRLYAKDPTNWQPAPRHGQGMLTFDHADSSFCFEAGGLQPRQTYALIQHHPGNHRQGFIIARMASDQHGQVHYQGQWSLWQGKIWLVLEQDVAGQEGDHDSDRLKGWHPHHYLFEEHIL